jgi:pimeloyl-ACP methyl ester carboxylesterase
VLLLHGFGEDGEIWNKQAELLKHKFRVIIPDIPGSGQSELIENADIETYAETVKAVLDIELQEEKKQAHTSTSSADAVIGHSMGGYITLAFAAKYPHCLNGMGLFHSTAFADSKEKKQVREKAIDFIKEKGAAIFLKASIPGLFAAQFAKTNSADIDALIEKGKRFSPAALIQYYRAMIDRPDRAAVLRNFTKPVLFIMGEHDNAVPLQNGLQQCYLPAIADVHILKQSAHMGMLEETEKANAAIVSFLSNIL